MIDYHIHTKLSDGKNTHDEILRVAIESGLKELGFSDHLCLNYPSWALKEADFGTMENKIQALKASNGSPVKVKFGLEVDYLEDREDEISDLLLNFPLDYVIGSVHYLGDWNFDTSSDDYINKDIDQFYIEYFRVIQKAAKSGLFDIMGHIDVAKKFNYYPSYNLNPYFEKTSRIFAEYNVVVELNTSGRDRSCNEFYPSYEFLGHCFKNNVPVTLGSDTHKKADIARYFPEAIALLKKVGYKRLAIFTCRKRNFISL